MSERTDPVGPEARRLSAACAAAANGPRLTVTPEDLAMLNEAEQWFSEAVDSWEGNPMPSENAGKWLLLGLRNIIGRMEAAPVARGTVTL